jgi:hypothetical protein
LLGLVWCLGRRNVFIELTRSNDVTSEVGDFFTDWALVLLMDDMCLEGLVISNEGGEKTEDS